MGSHNTHYALTVPHISECRPEDDLKKKDLTI